MAGRQVGSVQDALQALAALLHYPDEDVRQHAHELADVLSVRPEFPREDRVELERFVRRLQTADLLHQQAGWIETFDRSKKVSMYLFEHVYGESRSRGPAMVELRMAYREKGLEMAGNDLPDYLPLFLEFCAQLPAAEAHAWLEDVSHILQQVHVRLHQRGSRHALPFRLLLHLVQVEPWPAELMDSMAGEARDDTRAAIDDVWQEAPVTFEPGSALGACGNGNSIQQSDGLRAPDPKLRGGDTQWTS
ncbi:MAG: nitrate reductase molybdenum cofactor assembly chaperone [Halofilum sp. (in: g-proteobacteria)]|nr:nitrate reductase molybdenum cofactor assembly chaperone [Halofilum sp. (in: g-proteobacteria)]